MQLPKHMCAASLAGHGGVEKLGYRQDVPAPAPGPGEVLIRVSAAGINNTDINTRLGWYSKVVKVGTNATGSAATAIVPFGQIVPRRYLRCVLESRDQVSCKTADGDFPVIDGLVTAPATPGIGITPRMDVLGNPIASYS